jgi:hypothetical protein
MFAIAMQVIELPNPLLPNSLVDVMHAAECDSNAGITVENFEHWQLDERCDTACAKLLSAASRVVQPRKSFFYTTNLGKGPETVAAQIRWLSPVLQSLYITKHSKVPCLWQSLQCCCKLEQITIVIKDMCEFKDSISIYVRLAAEQYVAVINRPVMLSLPSSEDVCLAGAVCKLKNELQMDLPRSVDLSNCTSLPSELVIELKPVSSNGMNT